MDFSYSGAGLTPMGYLSEACRKNEIKEYCFRHSFADRLAAWLQLAKPALRRASENER
jgi:hypothetical protein